MPQKFEKIPMGAFDRRRKLSNEDREEIKNLRERGWSLRRIADSYGVSRTLITMICKPEVAEKYKVERKNRSLDGRYKKTKEQRAAIMREHRAYKKELYEKGLIG